MRLIEDWASHIWKLYSVRLAAFAGIVAAYFAAYPDELRKLIDMVPEEYRPLASMAIGLFVFATATGSRLIVQPKLTKPGDGE